MITTLRDPVDAEVFEAGKRTLKVVAQIAVGFDNINRADANRYKVPFTHTADVLTEATAEFAFFMLGALARKLWTRMDGFWFRCMTRGSADRRCWIRIPAGCGSCRSIIGAITDR